MMTATDKHATVEEFWGEVFSVRFVPRLYNEEQLPLVVSQSVCGRGVFCAIRAEVIQLPLVVSQSV
jgi:hypothetical protein